MNMTRQSTECARNEKRMSYTKGLLEALHAAWGLLAHLKLTVSITRHIPSTKAMLVGILQSIQ